MFTIDQVNENLKKSFAGHDCLCNGIHNEEYYITFFGVGEVLVGPEKIYIYHYQHEFERDENCRVHASGKLLFLMDDTKQIEKLHLSVGYKTVIEKPLSTIQKLQKYAGKAYVQAYKVLQELAASGDLLTCFLANDNQTFVCTYKNGSFKMPFKVSPIEAEQKEVEKIFSFFLD